MQAEQVIVVIGASAGGVEAISRLVAGLPGTFSASLFVTVHFPREGTSSLAKILGRLTPLRVQHAADLLVRLVDEVALRPGVPASNQGERH